MEKYIDEQGLSDLQASGLAVAKDLKPVQAVDRPARPALRARRDRRRPWSATSAIARRRRRAQRQDRRSGGDGLGAGFRSEQSVQRAGQGPAEPHVGRPLRNGLDLQELHLGHGARFRQGDAERAVSTPRSRSASATSAIHDFHGKNRVLSLPEVFIYSSNIGSAQEGRRRSASTATGNSCIGSGCSTAMQTELPEVARPTEPKVWKQVNSITIAFGHGVSTTPLQTAVGCAALMNGGYLIEPTFLPRTQRGGDGLGQEGGQAKRPSRACATSTRSTPRRARARTPRCPGYRVGGKTGTAEKVDQRPLLATKLHFNTFVAAFPMDDPQYLVLTIIDEPKPEKPGMDATSRLRMRGRSPAISSGVRRPCLA